MAWPGSLVESTSCRRGSEVGRCDVDRIPRTVCSSSLQRATLYRGVCGTCRRSVGDVDLSLSLSLSLYPCLCVCVDWSSFTDLTDGCGEHFLTGPGGEITSPGFPQSFGADVHCAWTIRVDDYQRVVLNFEQLDLGHSRRHDGQITLHASTR